MINSNIFDLYGCTDMLLTTIFRFQFFDENRQYLRCGLVWHRVILMLTKLVEDHLVPKSDDSIAAPQSDVKLSIVKAFGSEDDPEHHHRYRLQPRPPSVARSDSGSKSESVSSRPSRQKSAGRWTFTF